MKGLLNYAFP